MGEQRPGGSADGSHPSTRRAGGWAPEVALVAGALLVAADVATIASSGAGDPYFALTLLVSLLAATLVRIARPALPISAWYAALAGLAPATNLTESILDVLLGSAAGPMPIAWVDLVNHEVAVLSGVVAAYGLGLFPEGRFDARWQRRVLRLTWLAIPVPLLVTFGSVAIPLASYLDAPETANPLHLLPVSLSPAAGQAVLGLAFMVVLLGPVMLLARYRKALPDTRRRMRWLLLPVLVLVLGLAGNLLVSESTRVATWLLLLATNITGDLAIVLGILAPARLDPDKTLRKTLVYGGLWLAIAGIYVAGATLVGVTAARGLPQAWAIAIALLAAILFQPARTRLERLADRWLFGHRTDPARVVGRLGATLAETFDLESLIPRMTAALEDGLGLDWARVTIPGERDPRAVVTVPIMLDGEELGLVECGPKRKGAWTDDDRAVVATFARQASLAVGNVRLAADLTAYAAEVAASRTRLVRAQEVERRRIERNIHDGVQQELVALIGETGLLRRGLRRRPEQSLADVEADLTALQRGLEGLLVDLRELAAGVHPSLLSDQGLAAAVEALVRRHPARVELCIGAEVCAARLPEEIEGAAYFTVAEALANSLKHSSAETLRVELARPNGSLVVRVTDDGVGFTPPPPLGRGLSHLTERAAALGGTLRVASAPGAGTTLTAEFLLADPGGLA